MGVSTGWKRPPSKQPFDGSTGLDTPRRGFDGDLDTSDDCPVVAGLPLHIPRLHPGAPVQADCIGRPTLLGPDHGQVRRRQPGGALG